MRTFRLNGWQRIGIVLSVLWVPLGALLGLMAAVAPYRVCIRNPLNEMAWCDLVYRNTFTIEHLGSAAAFFALMPIPVGWLLTYATIWAVRWVWRGFNPPRPMNEEDGDAVLLNRIAGT
jgi:hypothetical protein